jgi:Sigma-70 region 2
VVRVDTRAERRADPTRRFDELFRRLYPRLYDLCHRLLVDRWEAEDVVQDAFVKLVDAPVIDRPDAAALPSGVDTRPRIMVTPARQLRFTPDAARVGRHLAAHGRSAAAVPARLDGATLAAEVPAAALLHYVAADGGPRLVVGQSRELTARVVDGTVTLEALREFLLDFPGLPPQTVRQLRAIGDWRNTLPLPVPADRIDRRATTIHGVLETVVLLTAGLLGSTFLPTLANAVVLFSLFGLAWLGGIVEFIGQTVANQTLANLGVAVSLLFPSDAIWRAASYYLQPPTFLGEAVGRGGIPFAALTPPTTALLAALRTFARRDL